MLKVILVFISIAGYGQHNSPKKEALLPQQRNLKRINKDTLIPVSDWRACPVPSKEEVEERKYGFDSKDWHIYNINNDVFATESVKPIVADKSLIISIKDEEEGKTFTIADNRKVVEVPGGYLVGLNKGEWGGTLYFVSSDKKKSYKISKDQVVQFLKFENKIYAVTGLSHLSSSEGSIIEMSKKGDRWISSQYMKLPSAPFGIGVDSKGNWIVGTEKGMLLIKPDKSVEVLADGFWQWQLYPNSLVVKDDKVYAGMRKGVYKYDLRTKSQQWLMAKGSN